MISGKEALHRIEIGFPDISEEIREDEGLLHIQIAAWSHLTQKVIDEGDKKSFEKICKLFCELFPNAHPDLENALNVSYLEHLNFKDEKKKRSWAYEAMPPMMKKAWDEMEEYNKKIHGG